jgi:hypothetical protein
MSYQGLTRKNGEVRYVEGLECVKGSELLGCALKAADKNLTCKYVEPEKKVVSRSGDECVVALCDQW